MRFRFFLLLISLSLVAMADGQGSRSWSWSDARPTDGFGIFRNFNMYSHNTALDGSYVNFNSIENTKGKRYLFDGWATGKVITSRGDIIDTDSAYYNFDKMNNTLLLSADKKNIIAVNRSEIKSFTLTYSKETYRFVRVDAINPQGFLQVLSEKINGHILYKAIKTKFQKADYHTDGLMESGKRYDEYSDEYKYYVVMPDGGSFKEVPLKSKSIKNVFADNPKANEFLSTRKGSRADEMFLIELINFLNE